MPVWLAGLGSAVGGALLSMGASLLTEAVLKKFILIGLRHVVKKTETSVDDEILATCEQAWAPKAP